MGAGTPGGAGGAPGPSWGPTEELGGFDSPSRAS